MEAGLGADHAFNFTVESLDTRDSRAKVKATVVDGGMQLKLEFEHFYAGDRLFFSIDVDEVQHFDPQETNRDEINSGLDPSLRGSSSKGVSFRRLSLLRTLKTSRAIHLYESVRFYYRAW